MRRSGLLRGFETRRSVVATVASAGLFAAGVPATGAAVASGGSQRAVERSARAPAGSGSRPRAKHDATLPPKLVELEHDAKQPHPNTIEVSASGTQSVIVSGHR